MNRPAIDLAVYAGIGAALLWFGAPTWSLLIPAAAAASALARTATKRP
ncbi:hypothetical protein K3888_13385 [Dietzia aurantiaca]|nr:hypothetical protein [Dietzia aurantiaca]MCD2263693.1 hypothetical protein [Dietzia aurantiaca]